MIPVALAQIAQSGATERNAAWSGMQIVHCRQLLAIDGLSRGLGGICWRPGSRNRARAWEPQTMFELSKFTLKDMTECAAALRKFGGQASSMEEVADKIVRYFHENLVDHSRKQ